MKVECGFLRSLDTRWVCADDIEWTFSRKRGFVPLYRNVDFILSWTRKQVAANRMVTFNVLIDRDGNLSPVLRVQESHRPGEGRFGDTPRLPSEPDAAVLRHGP